MSDPSVQTMTEAQWLFEYHALRMRDEEQHKLFGEMFRGLREMLVRVFGLDIVRFAKGPNEKEADPDAATPYVPASLLWSRPEALQYFQKQAEAEQATESAISDETFDRFSEELLRMANAGIDPTRPASSATPQPVLSPEEQRQRYWSSPEVRAELDRIAKPRKGP